MKFTSTKHGNEIIHELVNATSITSLKTLEDHLNLSRRSIFYAIKRLNKELDMMGLDPIENVRGAGYQLTKDTQKKIIDLESKKRLPINFFDFFENFIDFKNLMQKDRITLMKFCLISRKQTSLNDLTKYFNVSKNTVIKDLGIIKNNLPDTLTLKNGQHGKTIVGDEIACRQWVFENFLQLLNLISPYTKFIKNKWFEYQLRLLEKITGNYFTDESLLILSNFIGWDFERILSRPNCLLNTDIEEENYSLTYTWAMSLLNDLKINSKAEAAFLAEIVNTKAFQHINEDNPMISRIKPISKHIIQRFDDIAGVNLSNSDNSLNMKLTIHLVSTYYRVKYQINYRNPLVNQIKSTYTETFELVRLAILPFNEFTRAKLSDDEIALITVYFCGALRNLDYKLKRKENVMVVCSSGIGTSELLISQLRSHYPSINFTGPFNIFEYENSSFQDVKLVISTIKITKNLDEVPVMTVPVILSDSDLQEIENRFQEVGLVAYKKTNNINPVTIMDIVANHARIFDPTGLEKDLRLYLSNSSKLKLEEDNVPEAEFTFEVVNRSYNWEKAIQLSLAKLLSKNVITEKYIAEIINLTKTKGTYMAIGKGIFLAHATPKTGVNRLGVSYTLFKKPFEINHQKIFFVVGIAPVDNKKHLKVLGQLLQHSKSENWLKQLREIATPMALKKHVFL